MGEYIPKAVMAARACDLNDEAFSALIARYETGDEEADHAAGDDILVELIRRLKFEKTAAAWDKLGKWYA